jgi:CRP/FNR family transcriptional regulator
MAAALNRIPYIRSLPAADREALAAVCSFRQVPRAATVFVEGDEAAGIFLVVAGRIRIVRSSDDGREQVLHEERAGITLAEVPVFGGGGYVGSAIAVDESTVLFVPRHALTVALERHPRSATDVIRILAQRVRTLAAVVEDLSLRDVTARTAAYLVREMDRSAMRNLQLPPTREQLAAHIGTVREQVSRALSQLRAGGLIVVEGTSVVVADPEGLRRLARGRFRTESSQRARASQPSKTMK